MIYMGGKQLIAKHIIPIMLQHRSPNQCWVEPFVGGGNLIDKVDGPRIGADANEWAVQALVSIRDHVGNLPKNNIEFSEVDYKALRASDAYPHKGFAGFAYSYGGKWLGGWSRDATGRDYVAGAHRNAVKQSLRLQDVDLRVSKYDELQIPSGSLIYCDPPYASTTKYATLGEFDHVYFWDWCRSMIAGGHTLFVSEYQAPPDFVPVWERVAVSGLAKAERVEKLFVHRYQRRKRYGK